MATGCDPSGHLETLGVVVDDAALNPKLFLKNYYLPPANACIY
jgi:hypothetical protein